MHVRVPDPAVLRPLMTFLRSRGVIAFADDATSAEVVVPHLYHEREQQAIEALLEQFVASLPEPVELTLLP